LKKEEKTPPKSDVTADRRELLKVQLKKKQMQSADLYDDRSPTQQYRSLYRPKVPEALERFGEVYSFETVRCLPLEAMLSYDQNEVHEAMDHLSSTRYVDITSQHPSAGQQVLPIRHPLRIGCILSGGPAPGGHNVVIGLYDMAVKLHPNSEVIGFMGGIDGFFN